MIAKRVMRGNAGNFRKLGGYILNPDKLAKAAEKADPSEWRRTTDYILDIAGGGERTEGVRISNCHSVEVEWAIKEIELTQKMNQRAKGDRTYHLVVSFPPGERPTNDQLLDIEDELCTAIGLGKHQRISAVHTDTDHLHMHVAINQIHPQTYNCVEPWYDKQKLMKACQRLERKHGLQRTNHGDTATRPTPKAAVAGEQHRSAESLSNWLKAAVYPNIAKELDAAQSWHDVHALFVRYDLKIKPRGAGLVVQPIRGTAQVKASSVDCKLTHKALTSRFGAFVPPDRDAKLRAMKKSYRRMRVHRGDDVERLWRAYQTARQVAMAERKEAVAAVSKQIGERLSATNRWYWGCRNRIFEAGDLTAFGKESELSTLDLKYVRDRNAIEQQGRDQRKEAARNVAVPSWIGFLRDQVADGDIAARSVLEKQEKKFEQALQAHFNGGEDPDGDARERMLNELSPEVRENGVTVYRFRDGGRLARGGGELHCESKSPFAIRFLLNIYRAHGVGTEISNGGRPALNDILLKSAVAHDIDIRFQDPAAEAERQRLHALCQSNANFRALMEYAVEYSAARIDRDANVTCLAWEPNHAGEAIIENTVTLRNGSQAVVLRQDDRTLVKAIATGEANAIKQLTGQNVVISLDGQIRPGSAKRAARR